MSDVTIVSKSVEMSHGKTYYYECGEGPTLLLVHGAGFLSGRHSYLRAMPYLAENFRCISVDCLGFGQGDPLEQEYSFAYLVDHLREFQDVMGIAPCPLVGHSMGGWLGALFAYESPDRLTHFIDLAGGGASARPLSTMVGWNPPTEEKVREEMQRFGGTNITVDSLIAEKLETLANDKIVDGFRGVMHHMTGPETRQRYNTMRRFPHIKVPTLIIWGTEDKTNSIEDGYKAHELIPNSEMVVLEGSGHRLPTEEAEAVASAITSFVSSH